MSDKIICNTDNMSDVFARILRDYGAKASKAIGLAVEDEAKDIRKKIRQNVNPAGIKGGSPYKGGWMIDKQIRSFGVQCTVYNGGKQLGLVHLLEKGHRVVVKGKTYGQAKAYPHGAPAVDGMDADLERKINEKLELLD